MEMLLRWGRDVCHYCAGYRPAEIIDKSVYRFSIENKSFLASAWSLTGTVRKLSAIVNDAPASDKPRRPAQLTGWNTNE